MIIFFDGCGGFYTSDAHAQRLWDIWDANVLTTSGRRGGACIEFGQQDDASVFVPEQDTYVVGFAMRLPLFDTGDNYFRFSHGATNHTIMRMTANGAISIIGGAGSEIGVTANGVIAIDTYHYVEQKVFVHDTIGTYEIIVDGVQVLNLTGKDTRNGTETTINRINFGAFGNGGPFMRIDDLYVLDTTGDPPQNDFLGDCQIDLVLPNAVGATSDFTPSAGNNFENVDDATPDDDTTHNETPTDNDVDSFDYPSIPAITGGSTVICVKAVACVKKTESGLARMQLLTRPVATDIPGGVTHVLSTDYLYKTEYWDENPEVSAAWTDATFNAAEFGYKKVV